MFVRVLRFAGMSLELVDHRDDDAAVVVLQQLVQLRDAVGVLDVVQPERSPDSRSIWSSSSLRSISSKTVGLSASRRLEQQLGGLDHREGLAAPLRVPDQPARVAFGSQRRAATTFSTAVVWCWRRMNFCSSSSFSAKRM